MHVHKKRDTWWGIHPKKGKKGFATEAEAKAWAEDTAAPAPAEPEAEEE
jgi:hypothetical protein